MKRLLLSLLIVVFSVSVLACSNQQSQQSPKGAESQQLTLKFAELYPEDHTITNLDKLFAQKVLDKTQGRIKIEIYSNGQLGDEKSSYQALQMGAIDLFRGNTATLSDFHVKKINLFTLPYMFKDREHLWRVLNSEIGQQIINELQELKTDMVGLYFLDEGARNFFTTKKITGFDSLRGLKIRVPQTQMLMDTVAAIGASPTPISYSELFSALQTGTIDGAENPPEGYLSFKFYEPAPYYILDGHTYNPCIVLISEKTWGKLSDNDKKSLLEAGKEVQEINKKQAAEIDQKALKELAVRGVTIIDVPDKTPYIQATKSLIDKYAADQKDLVTAIQNK